jgi:hypothetical protein
LFVVQVFPGPKEWDSSNRYPAFLWYVAKKLKCFIPVRVFDGKRMVV